MATRKSPARGTGSRPAKATTAIGKSRPVAKKSLKVSAKPAGPETESNVVQMTAAEPAPMPAEAAPAEAVLADTPADPMPVTEEVVVAVERVIDPPVLVEEPALASDVTPAEYPAELMATLAEEAPEPDATVNDDTVEDEIVEEPEVEMTFKPNAFSGASLFPGFPQFASFPEMPAFGAVDMKTFVASGTAMVEGMQNIGNELMAFSRQTAERNVETTMAMLGASSVQEAIELQSRHATGSINDLMAESTKLSGMAMDVASKAASSFART